MKRTLFNSENLNMFSIVGNSKPKPPSSNGQGFGHANHGYQSPGHTSTSIWPRSIVNSPSHPSTSIFSGGHNRHEDPDGVASPPQPPPDIFQDREGGGGMRVGKDFQAKITPLIPEKERNVQGDPEKALLIWTPSDKISDNQVERYLKISRDEYHYAAEQALGLLYWHKYNVPKAIEDLGNFTPNPEEWTVEDQILFEQGFQNYGKDFNKIRHMLPDKSMARLIQYYYGWKKQKVKNSVMDRVQNQRQRVGGESSGVPERQRKQNGGENTTTTTTSGNCRNCEVACTVLHEFLCHTCFLYWKDSGESRPLTGPLRRGADKSVLVLGGGTVVSQAKRSPPRGMYINHDDLTLLASAPPQAQNVTLIGLETVVYDAKVRVQTLKQGLEILKRQLPQKKGDNEDDELQEFRPKESSRISGSGGGGSPRVNPRWTQEELLLAVQGVRRYGKIFAKIANLIESKTEAHLKSFYVNYRKRYKLDDLFKEFQKEHEVSEPSEAEGDQPLGT